MSAVERSGTSEIYSFVFTYAVVVIHCESGERVSISSVIRFESKEQVNGKHNVSDDKRSERVSVASEIYVVCRHLRCGCCSLSANIKFVAHSN